MKTSSRLVKFTLLTLSLPLVSTFAVAPVLPLMREFFAGYSADRVDLLISIPTFGILCMVILNIFFGDKIKETVMLGTGLWLVAIGGTAAFFVQNYTFILVTRFFLGIGIGLLNSKAISIIGSRFFGEERSFLLGVRGAFEALGNASLTLLSGALIMIHWTYAFLINAVGLPIFILYYFVIMRKSKDDAGDGKCAAECVSVVSDASAACDSSAVSVSGCVDESYVNRPFLYSAIFAFLNAALIVCSSILTLRVPIFVVEKNMGTPSTSSVLLSICIIANVFGGLCYSHVKNCLRGLFLPILLLMVGLGMAVVCTTSSILIMGIAQFCFGFFHTNGITFAFQKVADHLPPAKIDAGTSIVLIGCNAGAFFATYILAFIESILA